MSSECTREVSTGLDNTEVNRAILKSVFGQMSDGMWENTPSVTPYWSYATYDPSNTKIYISNSTDKKNPYCSMTDVQIRNYFARKIKHICIQELRDRGIVHPDKTFNDDNNMQLWYIHDATVANVRKAVAAIKKMNSSV